MKFKVFILVLGIILSVLLILGCTNPQDSTYSISNSNFQVPSSWAQHEPEILDNQTIKFKNYDKLSMNVVAINNEEYESEYQQSIQDTTGNYQITTETKNINNIEVKFVNATDSRNNDNFQDYFFQKNGKSYVIRVFDKSDAKPWSENIKEAVETVIKTMN